MSQVIVLTEQNWDQEVKDASVPVLVDFYATWCGPCRSLAPVIERLASKFADRAKVGKVDVDKQRALTEKYGINAMPTVLLFERGKVGPRWVGVRSEKEYADALEKDVDWMLKDMGF